MLRDNLELLAKQIPTQHPGSSLLALVAAAAAVEPPQEVLVQQVDFQHRGAAVAALVELATPARVAQELPGWRSSRRISSPWTPS